MTSSPETFSHPLAERYASPEMLALWSPRRKFRTWRALWVALAETQAELGLPVTPEQIAELKAHVDDIDFAAASRYERELRHDVMAHVRAYGDVCPQAAGIIHWGATSCFVTDNTDLLLMREGLRLVRSRLLAVIESLAEFAEKYKDQPCLGFTHLQPAQPTTVGKRACLWLYDLVQDLTELDHRLGQLKARGAKGTTGTQASFLQLFGGDHERVRQLDRRIAEKLGFEDSFAVTGQTYPRKVDTQVLEALGGIAQSAHKFASDLRLLQSWKEIEEPFEEHQIGSSAMAYKRNPMRSERMCGLARFVVSLSGNAAQTASTQWLERTLDDSANRRLVLPQAFLAVDALLLIYANVARGLVVYPRVIEQRLHAELPFMATETILMAAVEAGGNRQELHEKIRLHSQEAARQVKEQGGPNDLLSRLQAEPEFQHIDFASLLDPGQFIGRAPHQVEEFLQDVMRPLLQANQDRQPAVSSDLRV